MRLGLILALGVSLSSMLGCKSEKNPSSNTRNPEPGSGVVGFDSRRFGALSPDAVVLLTRDSGGRFVETECCGNEGKINWIRDVLKELNLRPFEEDRLITGMVVIWASKQLPDGSVVDAHSQHVPVVDGKICIEVNGEEWSVDVESFMEAARKLPE
jgi:hypothetical protein